MFPLLLDTFTLKSPSLMEKLHKSMILDYKYLIPLRLFYGRIQFHLILSINRKQFFSFLYGRPDFFLQINSCSFIVRCSGNLRQLSYSAVINSFHFSALIRMNNISKSTHCHLWLSSLTSDNLLHLFVSSSAFQHFYSNFVAVLSASHL